MKAGEASREPLQEAQESALELLASNSWPLNAAVLAASALIAAVCWPVLPAAWWAAWAALVALSQGLRMRCETLWCRPDSGLSLPRRMALAVQVALLCGSVQVLPLWAFEGLDITARSLYSVILLGLAAGAMGRVMGEPCIFGAYMLILLLSLTLAWVWVGARSSHTDEGRLCMAVGGLVLMFGWILRGSARSTWQLFTQVQAMRAHERQQNLRLARLAEEAQAASQAKTRFLASASHDLRQPVHTISLLAGVLRLRHPSGASASAVNLLDTVAQSLGQQLDDLLDISKLDAGLVQPKHQVLALAPFVQQCFDEFQPQALAKGLDCQLSLQQGGSVWVDPGLLQRVLRNLLGNALKFTTLGRIELALEVHATHAQVSVRDTGCGIAQADVGRVFDEFVQLNNPARDRSQGLGLGLSIVSRLCRLMAIEIQLESEVLRGSCFCLHLPLVQERMSVPRHSVSGPVVTPIQQGLRVLVLDDEYMVRQAAAMLLDELGCVAFQAHDTAGALAVLAHSCPDLVIADYRLDQGENGVQAVRQMRSLCPQLQAVIVSGEANPEQLQAVQSAGLELMHKPLSLPVLTQLLGRVSQGQAHHAHAAPPGDPP